MPTAPTREQLTGLLLAGGRGTRMGGVDKGLVLLDGDPLALHVLRRLQPQVGRVLISANRSHTAYAAWATVVADDAPDAFEGPLAGIAAALRSIETEWLAVAPCDLPRLPVDAFARLATGLQGAAAAFAAPGGDGHSLVCLLHVSLAARLDAVRAAGERRVRAWLAAADARAVRFDDAVAFSNLNAPEHLQAEQEPGRRR